MELCFNAFSKEFEVILKGTLSHKVTLGEDARGNLIRMDNALSGLSGRLERVQNELMNLENQQNAAREELQKPFPQERELAEKSVRLAELDAALNMDDSHPEAEHISDEQELVRRPSVLADLKARTGYSPISKRETDREEAVL